MGQLEQEQNQGASPSQLCGGPQLSWRDPENSTWAFPTQFVSPQF